MDLLGPQGHPPDGPKSPNQDPDREIRFFKNPDFSFFQLTAEHIEDALRIRMNGPSPDEFNSIKYATSWVNSGKMRSDAPNRVQPKRQRILNEKGEEIAEMEFKYMGGSHT